MKTILLLVFAVFVSSAPTEHVKTSLAELIDELDKVVKHFSKENEIYLANLHQHVCKPEVFCQAEQELIKKVSGLSGGIFDHFRTDKKLMRNLNAYNKHRGKPCKPADEIEQVPLRDFLKNLLTCVRKEFGQPKSN